MFRQPEDRPTNNVSRCKSKIHSQRGRISGGVNCGANYNLCVPSNETVFVYDTIFM